MIAVRFKNFVAALCLLSLLVAFLCPTPVIASTVASIEMDRIQQTLEEYLYVEEDGCLRFNKEAALLNNESDEIIQVGEKTEEIALAYYEYDLAQEQGIELAIYFPVYGNWCGPEYGSGLPIDELDAACMTHDTCYGEEVYHSCGCDRRLVSDVRAILPNLSGTTKLVAEALVAYFEFKSGNVTLEGGLTSCTEYEG